jgi:hypothetical protein
VLLAGMWCGVLLRSQICRASLSAHSAAYADEAGRACRRKPAPHTPAAYSRGGRLGKLLHGQAGLRNDWLHSVLHVQAEQPMRSQK